MAEEIGVLAYDLRQKYAEIVGFHLEMVAKARLDKNLPEYYDALTNLVIVIKHKFKKPKKDYSDEPTEKKKKKKTQEEEYKALLTIAINYITSNTETYQGRGNDDKAHSEIITSLFNIEMFLYYVMERAGMFGSISANRGL